MGGHHISVCSKTEFETKDPLRVSRFVKGTDLRVGL